MMEDNTEKKKNMCTTESLYCVAETGNTLYINYTFTKKKKKKKKKTTALKE